jgi:hypothetical protein
MLDGAVRREGYANMATAAEDALRREAHIERIEMTKPIEERQHKRVSSHGRGDRGHGPLEIIRLAGEDDEVEALFESARRF